jgi:hypothetical protein
VANPRVADRPAGAWPPEGRIVMTPYRPPNHYPSSVGLTMARTYRLIPTEIPVEPLGAFPIEPALVEPPTPQPILEPPPLEVDYGLDMTAMT